MVVGIGLPRRGRYLAKSSAALPISSPSIALRAAASAPTCGGDGTFAVAVEVAGYDANWPSSECAKIDV
jgi:hypothetical protein